MRGPGREGRGLGCGPPNVPAEAQVVSRGVGGVSRRLVGGGSFVSHATGTLHYICQERVSPCDCSPGSVDKAYKGELWKVRSQELNSLEACEKP